MRTGGGHDTTTRRLRAHDCRDPGLERVQLIHSSTNADPDGTGGRGERRRD